MKFITILPPPQRQPPPRLILYMTPTTLLSVMWIYATISPKLVEMIVDVDSTAHGVWNRLKDLFHYSASR
ncbi:hypothetical protein Tco_1147963, partial [Tanacetum coccineum]